MKMEKYSGLNALLSQNSQAKAYFSLPDYAGYDPTTYRPH